MTTSPPDRPFILPGEPGPCEVPPIGELTGHEIELLRANPERCQECLCCLSTCRCEQPSPRRASRPVTRPLAEVIQFPAGGRAQPRRPA